MAKFGLRSAASVASWAGGVRRWAAAALAAVGVASAPSALGAASPTQGDPPRRSLLAAVSAAEEAHGHGTGGCTCGHDTLRAIFGQLDLDAAREGEDPSVRRARFLANLRTSSTCFVRNPTPEQIRLIAERFGGRNPSEQAAAINNRFFLDFSAWDRGGQAVTQTTGQGRRINRLTYSFPADGTVWQRFNPLLPPPGYEPCPNDLNFHLDARFGQAGRDYGRELFRQVLAGWKFNAGVDYAEVCDDNAPLSLSLEPVGAMRGDIRFGACPQGTSFGILAFNFYPEFGGDMVLNSNYFTPFDYWSGGGSGQYRYLRNAIAHEHGHGLGFRHAVPCNETKLMEPFASIAYDMIQRDERRGAQHNYGDRYAGNHTPQTARELNLQHVISMNNPPSDPRYGSSGTNFRQAFPLDHDDPAAGIVPHSAIERELSTNGAVCDGCADPNDPAQITNPTGQDWFTFSLEHAYQVVVTVDPMGGSYANGPQGNMAQQDPCDGMVSNITAESAGNLNVQLFSVDPMTQALTEIRPGEGAMTPAGMNERLDGGLLPPGRYMIRVYDVGPNPIMLPNGDMNPDGTPAVQRMPTQLYDLMVRLGDANQPGAQLPYPPLAIAGVDKIVRVSIPPAGMDPGQPSIMSFIGDVSSRAQEPGAQALPSRVDFWEWDLDGDGVFETNADDFNNPPMGQPPIDPRAPFATAPTDNKLIPVTLRVTDSNGRRATDTIYVKVTGAPIVVTSVTPASGTQNTTVPIQINGSGLGAVTDASQITFDGLGVTCVGLPRASPDGTVLTGISALIDITAALGFRSVTVSDGCTVSNTLADAFEVLPQVPPPPQDECAGAERWPDDFGDKMWDNVGATTDPSQSYPGTPCNGEIIVGDVWYYWRVPECTSATIRAAVIPPPGMNVRMAVYRPILGIPPPIGCPPLAVLAACGSTPDFPLIIPVVPGELLVFRLGGAAPGQTGMGIVRLTVTDALGACCNAGVCVCTNVMNCLSGSFIPSVTCAPNPCPGVCCLVNGECRINLTQAQCDSAGPNSAWRTGDTCNPNPCPQLGACCFGTNCSANVYDTPCNDAGGRFLGRDSTCAPVNNCGGACCRLDGSCDFTTANDCANTQGNFGGNGTVCNPNTCPQPGACCFGTACSRVLSSVCTGPDARFLGENSVCLPMVCDPGACCDNGACIIVIGAECARAGTVFLGPNTTCAPDPCDPGACCSDTGTCTLFAAYECTAAAGLTFLGAGVACDAAACIRGACCGGAGGGECVQDYAQLCVDSSRRFVGPATTCQPNECVGACCAGSGACSLVVPSMCTGAGVSFQGAGTVCGPNPCPQPGACCRGTVCAFGLPADCTGGGALFLGAGSTCVPTTCVVGACCEAGACTSTLGGQCTGLGSAFIGAGTTCSPDPCDPGACCNTTGGCSVRAGFECAALGLTFLGAGVACDAATCVRGACCSAGSACALEFGTICVDSGRRFIAPGAACLPNPCTGACCNTVTGACELRTAGACTGTNFNYLGDGTACNPGACGPTGACCLDRGTLLCGIRTPAGCTNSGESFLGIGTACDPAACDLGACCTGAACALEYQALCTGGSIFVGITTTCSATVCNSGACCTGAACVDTIAALCTDAGSRFVSGEPCSAQACTPGACCSGGACALLIAADCPGTFIGPGTACSPTACSSGACCAGSGGACVDTIGALCTDAGSRFIAGEPCSAMACTPGACCTAGACTLTVAADCAAVFAGPGTACSPTACSSGACCTGAACVDTIGALCTSAGSRFIAGEPCSAMACTPGACCIGTACTETVAADCAGTFAGPGVACTPLLCRFVGACCSGTLCAVTTDTDCTNSGGTFQGQGVACGTTGNPTTCCPANVNGIDGLSVQDIFDYLSWWLATPPDPRAEFDGVPGIGLQDLFSFLAAWFAGCDTSGGPGACCQGSTCTIVTASQCATVGGTYNGPASACGTSPSNPTTCCLANVNGVDGVTLQDIFDYLNLYFTGDPAADINGVGGVTLDDLFIFLNLYFLGCA